MLIDQNPLWRGGKLLAEKLVQRIVPYFGVGGVILYNLDILTYTDTK